MRASCNPIQITLAVSIALPLLAAKPVEAQIARHLSRAFHEIKYSGKEPASGCDGAIERLAENIDWLEHHIDAYGSIVAKQPDIWGEARLTRHRDETEQMLFQELNQFKFRINATIEQSDSSFLAQSMALSAAASGQTPTPPSATAPLVNITPDPAEVDLTKIEGVDKIGIEPTVFLDQLSRYLHHLHELRRINEGDDTSDSPGYSLNLLRVPISILPGKHTRTGYGAEITISVEPVVTADLLPTTFRNLVVNDLVAQLGLPLVRITEQYPTVAREYQKTQPIRFAADELARLRSAIEFELGTTDADQIPVTEEQYGKIFPPIMATVGRLNIPGIEGLSPQVRNNSLTLIDKLGALAGQVQQTKILDKSAVYRLIEDATVAWGDVFVDLSTKFSGSAAPAGRTRQAKHPVPPSQVEAVYGMGELLQVAKILCKTYSGRHIRWSGKPCCECDHAASDVPCTTGKCSDDSRVTLVDARKFLQAEIDAAFELLAEPRHLLLWYRLAKPDSGLAEAIRRGHLRTPIHGVRSVQNFRELFFYTLHRHHLQPDNVTTKFLWPSQLPPLAPRKRSRVSLTARNPVEALAWAVIVESALLNQRLNEDVRKVAIAKQCYELQTDREFCYFLPESVMRPPAPTTHVALQSGFEELPTPGAEVIDTSLFPLREEYQLATEVFQRYVLCRWPIHVFALDPVAQDQNVADASKRKRELQFAVSLAFVTGQIGGNSLTQFSRDLQTEVNTIALNRTAAGFAHGPDTFGWRFYPRVQGLDVPGTAGAIWQTIRGTPRDADVRNRQIEPGMRECIAIVLMPSFVPYVDTHVRSNWFKLTNPKKAALTMKDTVRLSRAITAMRDSRIACIRCAHLYRPGEVDRLLQRVKQLDRELPLQTMRVQVPFENTRGGFEMFSMGTTDLAPELVGWHGAPGIVVHDDGTNQYACGCAAACREGARALVGVNEGNTTLKKATPMPACDGKGTSLFLVGDNFSVHDTRAIAGGVCIPHVQLISRQIMRVVIPSCVNTVCVDDKDYVAIHVATPYGVTNHLHIPVHRRDLAKCPNETAGSPIPAPVPDDVRLRARSVFQPAHSVRLQRAAPEHVPVAWNQPLDEVVLVRLPPVDSVVMPAVQRKWQLTAGPRRLHSVAHRTPAVFVQAPGDETGDMDTPDKLPIQIETPVQVNVLVEDKDQRRELWDKRKYPLLNRMKVRFRENWRNCRDKLPGN